jgi:hypothetical protein
VCLNLPKGGPLTPARVRITQIAFHGEELRMIIRFASTRAVPLTQGPLHRNRRRWSALQIWVSQQWHRSHITRDRVQATHDRHLCSYLSRRWGRRL